MPFSKARTKFQQVFTASTEYAFAHNASLAISKLPPEILSSILQVLLKDGGIRFLANALRVSKQWHEVGSTLLWQDLVLADSSIEKLADAIGRTKARTELTDQVRSLTLRFLSPGNENFRLDPFSRSVHTLALLLPLMNNLKSFSVISCYSTFSPWSTKQVTDEIVIDLINHLPRSIQHLEVDVQIAYFKAGATWSCLCQTISERLEGLQSLRLRWPRICSRLFRRRSTTLRYFNMDCSTAEINAYVRGCKSARLSTQMSWDQLQQQSTRSSHAAIQDVLRPLRESSLVELLPSLQHFIILEPYHFWPRHSRHQWFLLNVYTVCEASAGSSGVSQLIMTSHPIWPAGKYILRCCVHDKASQPDPKIVHNCADTDLWGSWEAIRSKLDGDECWTTSDTRARQPPSAKRRCSPDAINTIQSKMQREILYKDFRRIALVEEDEDGIVYNEPIPSRNLEYDVKLAKEFERQYDVLAATVGADYVWWLEKRLGHNVLCARKYLDEAALTSNEAVQEQFTSVHELVGKVQEEIPWVD